MINTNRQFTADNEYIGTADGNRSGGDGYKTANYFARNTDKQFTSDNEYSGTASSVHSKQMLYDNMYNARVNHVREGTLVGRKPTDSNVSKFINSDDINISIKNLITIELIIELLLF